MNRALLNPFETRLLPDTIDDYLPDFKVTRFLFNKHGNLLAAGTLAGATIVFDFETRKVATKLGEDLPLHVVVTSLSFPFPHTGALTLVAYHSGFIRCYDTLTTKVVTQIRFKDAPKIVQVVSHPHVRNIAVIAFQGCVPVLVRMGQGCFVVDSVWTEEQAMKPMVYMRDREEEEKEREKMFQESLWGAKTVVTPLGYGDEVHVLDKRVVYAAGWERAGSAIFRGGPGGLIKVFHLEPFGLEKGRVDARSDPEISRTTFVVVSGKAAIKDIVTSARGDRILINSNDRSLRVFKPASLLHDYMQSEAGYAESGVLANRTLEPSLTFNDPVNRVQWRCCCFSGDGEYVLGGLMGPSHRIPIYRLSDGLLEKTLEGPKEGISDLAWHPMQGVILSLGTSYRGIYVWQRNYTENWSAFAPDFTELEENEEYDEPEDEFDRKDDKVKALEEKEKEEEIFVDVVGGPVDDRFWIPAVPIPDKKKKKTGRKSKKRKASEMNGEGCAPAQEPRTVLRL